MNRSSAMFILRDKVFSKNQQHPFSAHGQPIPVNTKNDKRFSHLLGFETVLEKRIFANKRLKFRSCNEARESAIEITIVSPKNKLNSKFEKTLRRVSDSRHKLKTK